MLTSVLLVASLVVGQAETENAEQPEFNEHLEPVAWLVGDWERTSKNPLGELRSTRHLSWNWAANNEVLLGEFQDIKADGSKGMAAILVCYWDASVKKIKMKAYFSAGGTEEQTLVSTEGNEALWESRMVLPSGEQGFFHCKRTKHEDSYTLGWSKIAGSGPSGFGPHEYKRK
jgi:hypothetical protein